MHIFLLETVFKKRPLIIVNACFLLFFSTTNAPPPSPLSACVVCKSPTNFDRSSS